MVANQTGLSRDLIIHPGVTLSEVLEERGMTQKELAARTGFTEKHISSIVKGKKKISFNFAKSLEYAFNINYKFWINLQVNYDNDLREYEDRNQIDKKEIEIEKKLRSMLDYFRPLLPSLEGNEEIKVIELRKILNISNLTQIPDLAITDAWFRTSNIGIDLVSTYVWVKLCSMSLNEMKIENAFDLNKLKSKINDIRSLMNEEINIAIREITQIFSECGIAFKLFKSFKNIPVQGFTKFVDGKMLLCMTIRNKFADIFWFTLFHEIGHIVNGDAVRGMIDFESVVSEKEKKADEFAANTLINLDNYNNFIAQNNFGYDAIDKFAQREGIIPCIIIGRLQREKRIPYSYLANKKIKYEWKE